MSAVKVERCRNYGGPWLGLQLADKLRLGEFLRKTLPRGQEDVPWAEMALVLVLSRLCNPSSELRIAEHTYQHSAMADLLGIPPEKVNDNRLYRALDKLLPHKEELEKFLVGRMGQLFDLQYDLLLYDITSTYFEGRQSGGDLARRGYSRDKRPDCKQVCIDWWFPEAVCPWGMRYLRETALTPQLLSISLRRWKGGMGLLIGCGRWTGEWSVKRTSSFSVMVIVGILSVLPKAS